MAEDEIFETIIEPKIISLNLRDQRHRKESRVSFRDLFDFQVISARNTTEWVLGRGLSKEEVDKILADKSRQIEVHLVEFAKLK